MSALLVGVGAALGSALRYLAGRLGDGRLHQGTMAVNVLGSFLLGWLVSAGTNPAVTALIGTGFCGGLTTYSSFVVQAANLPRARGAAYVALTALGSLGAAVLGWWLAAVC